MSALQVVDRRELTEHQKENLARWAQALRSGDFRQATGTLKTDTGHCCLGVAAEIASDELLQATGTERQRRPFGHLSLYEGDLRSSVGLTQSLAEAHGLFGNAQGRLAELNDMGRLTFADIADHLTAYAETGILELPR